MQAPQQQFVDLIARLIAHKYAAEDVRWERVWSARAYFNESSDKNDGLPPPQEDIARYRDMLILRARAGAADLGGRRRMAWGGVRHAMPASDWHQQPGAGVGGP